MTSKDVCLEPYEFVHTNQQCYVMLELAVG